MSGATKLRDLQAGTSEMMDSTAMETEEYYNQEGGEGEWSQKVDTGQLCRVCANPNEYLIPIFDGEGLEHELAMKIQKHLPIKITETDTLPLHICYQCASTLIAWHDLVISCVEADKKLRELQVEDEDDDDDKGAEMFESHSMDSDPADEVDQPSTSEVQTQITKAPPSKKATPNKEKKPKLKMVLVKGPPAGTSGQKTGAKTQLAKALEQAKSKEGGNEDSASERCQTSLTHSHHQERAGAKCNRVQKLSFTDKIGSNMKGNENALVMSEPNSTGISMTSDSKQATNDSSSEMDNNLSTSETSETDDELTSDSVVHEIEKSPFCCEYCRKVFKRRDYLTEHIKVHLEIRPFVCHLCGKQYRKKYALKTHIQRVHDKKKAYECDICEKKFGYKESRDDHRRTHTGERPLMCDKCGKAYPSHTALYVHKRTHTDYYPFTCSYCSKKFRTRTTLNNHIVGHTGEKHHPCDLCGKMFGTRGILLEHRKIHSGERPYVCNLCGRAFKRRGHLRTHGKTHREIQQK